MTRWRSEFRARIEGSQSDSTLQLCESGAVPVVIGKPSALYVNVGDFVMIFVCILGKAVKVLYRNAYLAEPFQDGTMQLSVCQIVRGCLLV